MVLVGLFLDTYGKGLFLACVFGACVCRDAHMIMEDIKRTVSELEQESSLPAVGVELVDNELSMLYMNSTKSQVHTLTPYTHTVHTYTP